jgi:hypothetical protein
MHIFAVFVMQPNANLASFDTAGQRGFCCPSHSHVANKFIEQWVCDKTSRRINHIVGAAATKTQSTVWSNGHAQCGARGSWRHNAASNDFECFDLAIAAQCFANDGDFCSHVLRNVEVLPRAATAATGNMLAWWSDAMRRWLNNARNCAPCKILFGLSDLHID